MASIKTKDEFYKLYNNGMLGNRLRTFDSWHELYDSDYDGNVSIRTKITGYEQYKRYHIPVGDALEQVVKWWVIDNAPIEIFKFNESPPDDKLLIQGELMNDVGGLILNYSFEKTPLSVAMNSAKVAYRTQVNILLKHFMDGSSYDDIQILLNKYPDSVIEFGVYSCDVGIIKNRNTIIWEVRNY